MADASAVKARPSVGTNNDTGRACAIDTSTIQDNEMESMILSETERIQRANKRANTRSVQTALANKYGLDADSTLTHISRLLNCGKLNSVNFKGDESFRIPLQRDELMKDEKLQPDDISPEVDLFGSSITSDLSMNHNDNHNDSFLTFLDNVKTPVRDNQQNLKSSWSLGNSIPTPAVMIINKLVESNNNLINMLTMERSRTNALLNENLTLSEELKGLKLQLPKPLHPTLKTNQASQPTEIVDTTAETTADTTVDTTVDTSIQSTDSIKSNLAEQLKAVKIMKHQEFNHWKSQSPKGNELSTKPCIQNKNDDTKQANAQQKESAKEETTVTKTEAPNNADDSSKWRKVKRRKNKGRNNKSASGNENTSQSNASGERKVLLLGDSHVRQLGESHLLSKQISANGIGGLRSNQILSRHKQVINSELASCDEVIIHIGSNDIAKGIQQDKIVKNIDFTTKKLKDLNPDVKLTVCSIFLQGYDTPRNVKVIEVNQAIKRYCLTQGLDYIDHGNIAFKHLDHGGMHLSPEGNRLFAKNINSHVMSG